jgi:precorrin isomerase
MIKHIVMWKLKPENKIENAKEIKKRIEGLQAIITDVKLIEVGININELDGAYDIVLYSEFADIKKLNNYQNNPKHLEVVKFIKQVTETRIFVDYLT